MADRSAIIQVRRLEKIECKSEGRLRLKVHVKKYYADCSISSHYGSLFSMTFANEDALYEAFRSSAGLGYPDKKNSKLLFLKNIYDITYTCGDIEYSLKRIIDRLLLNYPNYVAVTNSCIPGEITSAISSDSPSVYPNTTWTGKYFAVRVGQIGIENAAVKIALSGAQGVYTKEFTAEQGDCYMFQTETRTLRLNIRAIWSGTFVQFRESIVPASYFDITVCKKLTFEEYVPQILDDLIPPEPVEPIDYAEEQIAGEPGLTGPVSEFIYGATLLIIIAAFMMRK